MTKNQNIYISDKKSFDLNKTYDEYAKEVLSRKGYPLRAAYKAWILYKFSLPIIKKISSIADVGGCYGYCLARFQKLYERKYQTKITSIVYELGEEYLKTGPKIFSDIEFVHSDKMGDKKYDLVLLCDVLEHVVDYDEFLEKIKNISKKYILLWQPAELTLFRKILIRLKLLPKIKWGQENPEHHVNFWNKKEILNILNDHFKILKIGYVTGREGAGGYSREVLPSEKSALVKIFYPLVKYIPDYLYIKLIGGSFIILCEVCDKKVN